MWVQAADSAQIIEGCPIAKSETIAIDVMIGSHASWKITEEVRGISRGAYIDKTADEKY